MDARCAGGKSGADFVANGTELLINSVIDKTLGPEAALLYRMGINWRGHDAGPRKRKTRWNSSTGRGRSAQAALRLAAQFPAQ